MNLNDFMTLLQRGGNPQTLTLYLLQEAAKTNPFYQNILSLVQNNKFDDVNKIAQNAMQSQGKDFNKEFNSFKQQFKH